MDLRQKAFNSFFVCFLHKNKIALAVFSVTAKKRWDREAQAAFKDVQLIKNRTDTQTQQTHLPVCAYTDICTNTHMYTAYCPPSQHIVYKWSSNGQGVIRHNKGATSANLLACSVLLCVLCFHVSVCVCVCASISIHLTLLYTYSRRLRCTYWSIYDSQEAA